MSFIKISNREIGDLQPVYFIAELSANHEQNLELAKRTIIEMKNSGADAVKVQTFLPETITMDSDKPWFRTRNDSPWAGMRLFDLYKKAYLPWEWHDELKQFAENLGLDFFSSPFDFSAVDFLESLNVPAYKIASPEITDIPLIEKVAKTGKPIIISTGIAEYEDIKLAVETCIKAGNSQIALLKCTTEYPASFSEVNLNQMAALRKDFPAVIGLSDHTLGIEVPIASVVLGAKIIEKHFMLRNNSESVDKAFSLTPDKFAEMVRTVRNIEEALGNGTYDLSDKIKNAKKSARSLFVVENVKKGDVISEKNVKSLRPGIGLHPKYYHEILGKNFMLDIEKGEPLKFEFIENGEQFLK
jgi:pseudaminic acid synthase